ncbi:hypothetical protein L6255_02265 [Candidatus Parcubacteria bacterium]|nr:hypothetical protein [Patescibacteria group bacterium]MBU4381209.1 hypothetical protein [Patescibacteria group bacterium]MCG2689241.1 hypothetical protein [Candidatus Parcubacteria bacterium]
MQITKNFALLCENTSLDKDNKITLFNVFDVIKVRFALPGVYAKLYIVVNFELKGLQPDRKELVTKLKIKRPDGNYSDVGLSINVSVDPSKEVQTVGAIFGVHNLQLSEEGVYCAEIFVEDNVEAEVKFEVTANS